MVATKPHMVIKCLKCGECHKGTEFNLNTHRQIVTTAVGSAECLLKIHIPGPYMMRIESGSHLQCCLKLIINITLVNADWTPSLFDFR